MHPYLTTLALAALFAFADRWTGGGFGWRRLSVDHGGTWRGRPIYYVALPVLAVCAILGGWPAAALALLWGVYRASFGFPDDTITGRDLCSTWLRHAVMGVFAVPVGLAAHWPARALLPFAGYVVVAVVLAKWNGDAIKDYGNINGKVEKLRGASFGLAVGAALALALSVGFRPHLD